MKLKTMIFRWKDIPLRIPFEFVFLPRSAGLVNPGRNYFEYTGGMVGGELGSCRLQVNTRAFAKALCLIPMRLRSFDRDRPVRMVFVKHSPRVMEVFEIDNVRKSDTLPNVRKKVV